MISIWVSLLVEVMSRMAHSNLRNRLLEELQFFEKYPFQLPFWAGAVITLSFALLIEAFRQAGIVVPIPFMLLIVATLLSASLGGLRAGLLSAAVWAGYVIYAATVSFGPPTLTGSPYRVSLGVLVILLTVLRQGLTSDRNRQLTRQLKCLNETLETQVKARTAELSESNARLRQEIQERDRVEAALRKTEKQFREAQRIAQLGRWELTMDQQTMSWSDEMFRILEIDPANGASYKAFLKVVHPDEREVVDAIYTNSLCDGTPYSLAYRLLMPDGRVKHIQQYCETIYAADGTPLLSQGTVQDITERKRLEAERFQAEQTRYELTLLEEILDNLLAGYWNWDIANHQEYLSPGFKRMFGYEDHELPNTPDSWQQLIFPEDLPGVLDCFERHVQSHGKIPYYNEVRYRHKDGSTVWVICSGKVIKWGQDGTPLQMIGCHIDISGLKQTEVALQESEARFRDLINSTPMLLWMSGIDKLCYHFNQRWLNFRGRTIEQEMGNGWTEGVHPDDFQPCLDIYTKAFDQRRSFEMEYRLQRFDGVYRWILDVGVPRYSTGGQFLGYIGSCIDISDRKRAEAQAKQYMAELETSNRELESFAYSVSHDLRAPLRAIDGFSQALLEDYTDTFDQEGTEYFSRIRKNVHQMGTLIDNLLSLSRVSRSEMYHTHVNLSALIQELMAELQASEPERQVEFIVAPEICVWADKTLMRIVMSNLLHNAWKFTSHHASARIEFGMLSSDSHRQAVYFIRDDGAGFNMAYDKMLFSAFQRLHTHHEFPGTGIGLATVQRIIHRHQGKIWAEAEVGQGATFFFTISNNHCLASL